jgi:hypothetical protein
VSKQSSTDLALLLLGLLAWAIAGVFGGLLTATSSTVAAGGGRIEVQSPNVAAGGAAAGFAIAGGLCFLGAGLTSCRHIGDSPPKANISRDAP